MQALEAQVSQKENALNTLQESLMTVDERIARYERRLAGQSDSMLDSINRGLSSFTASIGEVDIFKIQAQLEASVENLLNLMMLYLLKTLLLPLLFMYLLIKGFQQIWQVNVADCSSHLQRQKQKKRLDAANLNRDTNSVFPPSNPAQQGALNRS